MIVGPNPKTRAFHNGTPSGEVAFTTTPCFWRSCESWFVLANDGISVTKWADAVDDARGFRRLFEVALELTRRSR